MPTPPKPAGGMEAMPASKPSESMGAMPSTPSNQGMAMAEEMEEANHGASANGGRILWAFLILNAGIIAAAALLKSKRTFAKSSLEVKP